MNYVDYRISLDVSKTVSSVVLNAKRKDSGRRISITLTEGTSAYPIAEDCSAVFTARKPDGNVVYNSCTVEAGIICCRVTEQLTAVAGVISCEIKLFSAAGEQLTGALFYLAVEETVFEEGDIPGSASEIGVVADIVEQAKNAVTESGETLLRARNAAQAATQAVQTAQKVITDAEQAAKTAQAAAQRAEGASETAYTALQTAQEADRKVDTLREAVSSFHANIEIKTEGEIISLTDSAEAPLQGLRVYGRTTQAGTPSPEAPIPLVSAGDGGSLTVTAAGKNLMTYPYSDGASKVDKGITYTVNTDGSVKVNGTATEDSYFMLIDHTDFVGTFTISGCPAGGDNSGYMISTNGYNAQHKDYGSGFSVILTGEEAQTNIIILIRKGCSVSNLVFYPQLEAGTEKTAYEPYAGTTLTLSTPNGLPGIPVTSGGNYTDGAGQQWLCDEVDLAKGVYIQRVAKQVFTGSEIPASVSTAGGWVQYFTSALPGGPGKPKSSTQIRSNYYKADDSTGAGDRIVLYTEGTVRVLIYDGRIKTDLTTIGAWMADVKAKYDGGTPLTVVYALAEPVETTLSEDELIGYTKLYTQYLNTTVYNDAGAGMEVTYLADTKTYIDNKFDQLALALVSST